MPGDFLFTLTIKFLELVWLALVLVLCLALSLLTLPFLLAAELSRALNRTVTGIFRGIS